MNSKLLLLVSALAALSAFSDTDPIDQLVSGTGPEEYVACTGMKDVRNYAFCDNRSIRSICVPDAISVGSGAFRGCILLETIILPSLSDISRMSGIFSGCVKLTNVYLGALDFTSPERMNGFPWGAPNSGIIFHFRNGDFDRFGRKLN